MKHTVLTGKWTPQVELTPGKNNRFSMWVIYDKPSDFPDRIIARRHTPDGPTSEILMKPLGTLQALFKAQGYVRMNRFMQDDPVIVEVWI